MNKDKVILILVGIPCSGKSTWTENFRPFWESYHKLIISRDYFREHYFNNYKITKENELKVTEFFNEALESWLYNFNITSTYILDDTHYKEKYIDEIIKNYGENCTIKIKFFDISLFKAKLRNISRWFYTGKWIPMSVMNNMYENYNKIDRDKYAKYTIT